MAVAFILLTWALAWLAAPPLLKGQLQTRLTELLGRPVSVGSVGFQPWRLELTVQDIAIGEAQGTAPSEPLLRIAQVRANLAFWPLLRLVPVVEALDIEAPRLKIARLSAGHYDIDDLIDRFGTHSAPSTAPPMQWALYNLRVHDAQLRFDDRPAGRVQQIESLRLDLPFITNRKDEIEVKVEPRLAFKLNGASFDSGAQITPFAPTRAGALRLDFGGLDLAPYLGYLPASLPVRVTQGRLSAALSLQFAVPPSGVPTLTLKGKIGATDLALADRAGAPLLSWQRLELGLRDVEPLARRLMFGGLLIDAMQLHAARNAAGRINLLSLGAPTGDTTKAPAAEGAAAAWQIGLDTLDLANAQVRWNDASVSPAAAMQLDGLDLNAKQLRWPLPAQNTSPMSLALKGLLRAQGPDDRSLASFSVEGPLSGQGAQLQLRINELSLCALAPYLAGVLRPRLTGLASISARLDWSAPMQAMDSRLRLSVDSLSLDALALRDGQERQAPDVLGFKQLLLADTQLDLLARSVEIGSVKLAQPRLKLARNQTGQLSLQRWMIPAATPSAAASPSQPPWHVRVKKLQLDGGEALFADASLPSEPGTEGRRIALTNLRLDLQGFEWFGEQPVAPAQLQFSARIGAPKQARTQATTGSLDYRGRAGPQPLQAVGRLRIERFPVQVLAPYFAADLPVALLRAEAGYTGEVALRLLPQGLEASASGDVLLGDVHVATQPEPGGVASEADKHELLTWQSLALKRLKVVLKPQSRPQIDIGEAALTDFYARLLITEKGQFNLQQVAHETDAQTPESPAPADAPASLPLDIRVGVTTLSQGRVDFSDHFVRPNYSATLTELRGRLGAFSSTSREMATLELRGRAEGTALLEVSGALNPTVTPPALDIQAKATDLELPPLSPYAGKYAGYAIERGKLSMTVRYRIDADGQLEASNQLVLNQLDFGERIESKDATSLPVRLALALLKDRDGVIDINLPISGSLKDPKFSVGGIIVKVIVNLLTKAVMAPFSLFAGSGSADLSRIEFLPGTALMADSSHAALDKVVQALNDRPSLRMTVTGSADAAGEREAFQEAAIQARLLTEQRREALRGGATAHDAGELPPISEGERLRLLKQVYKEADIPSKPRNLLGLAKDTPAEDMLALLKTRVPVSEESARELALHRGIAVRDALIAKGLPSERVFLAAPRLHEAGEDDDAPWTPSVQLSLSTQ